VTHRPISPARRRVRQGFTLVELLIVLVILGLLASIAAPQLFGQLGKARAQSAAVQIRNLETALDLYRLEVGSYPTQEQGLRALVERPDGAIGWGGPYLRKADELTDPWGRSFHYRRPGERGGDYDLWSFGADGAAGGTGENREIGNW
jgi:general secretion pathway protein G